MIVETIVILVLLAAASWLFAATCLSAPDHSRFDEPRQELHRDRSTVSPQHDEVVRLVEMMNRQVSGTSRLKRIHRLRRIFDDGFTGSPLTAHELGVTISATDANGVSAEWILAPGASDDRRLFYIHGGAFAIGSPTSHRMITAALSKACGVAVLAIDYRLLPEHFRGSAIADCQDAYAYLLENGPAGGGDATDVYLAGDSAGGNLTLMLSAWARDRELRSMDAVVAFSPSTDATLSNPSMRENFRTDPMLGPGLGPLASLPAPLRALLASLMGPRNSRSPQMSPLFGDLRGLPPTLILVGDREMLFDDSQRYANKARSQGSPVTLQVWPEMVHVWPMFQHVLPEARLAIDEVAAFIAANGSTTRDAGAALAANQNRALRG